MQDLQQQENTKYGQTMVGKNSGYVPKNKLPSVLPELVGKKFGKLIITTGKITRKQCTKKPQIETLCSICGNVSTKDYTSVIKGLAGCRKCAKPRKIPKWLMQRCVSAKQRCTNKNDTAYYRYGERGVKFMFSSPTEMGLWIIENLGLHREKQIDRIDNNGNYEKGNLRLSTAEQNLCHTQKKTHITGNPLYKTLSQRNKICRLNFKSSNIKGIFYRRNKKKGKRNFPRTKHMQSLRY